MRKLLSAITASTVMVLLTLAPTSASATTGSLANAYANAEWTKASFDVSVSATPCLTGSCSWNAIVMAQSNLPSYSCAHQEWADSDPNTQEAWISPQFAANSTYSTHVTEVPILNRVNGQRLCLEIFGQSEHTSPVCEAQRPILEEFLHEPQPPCPVEKFIFSENVGGALLTIAPPAPVIAPPSPAPAAPVVTPTTPTTKPLVCPKGKRKVVKDGKPTCVKRHKKHRRHVSSGSH